MPPAIQFGLLLGQKFSQHVFGRRRGTTVRTTIGAGCAVRS
jgi:hypothetical protein